MIYTSDIKILFEVKNNYNVLPHILLRNNIIKMAHKLGRYINIVTSNHHLHSSFKSL